MSLNKRKREKVCMKTNDRERLVRKTEKHIRYLALNAWDLPAPLAFDLAFVTGSSVGNATWLAMLRHFLAFTTIRRAGQRTSGFIFDNFWRSVPIRTNSATICWPHRWHHCQNFRTGCWVEGRCLSWACLVGWSFVRSCVCLFIFCLCACLLFKDQQHARCIWRSDLLGQLYVLPHWDRNCWSNSHNHITLTPEQPVRALTMTTGAGHGSH